MSKSTSAPDERKPCIKCGEVKPLDQFPRRGNTCKLCVNAHRRQRYAEDPEFRSRLLQATKKWDTSNAPARVERYWQNREQYVAANREYYQRNRERLAADARERARSNPEPGRARARAWARANPDRQRELERAWRLANPERSAEKSRRCNARRRARLRGLPAETYTMAQILERDGTMCVLCGRTLNLAVDPPHPMSPTVEHLECISWPDSAGDVLANVAVSHYRCNVSRGDRPHPAATRKRGELLAASKATT